MENIKECPFCGNMPTEPKTNNEGWFIECIHCDIIMNDIHKINLIKRWNTRSSGNNFKNKKVQIINAYALTYKLIGTIEYFNTENNEYKVNFNDAWVGWYKLNELKFID